MLTGRAAPESVASPVYFMTEDNVTSGLSQRNVLTGDPFGSLAPPACIESVVTGLPTGPDGATELWKLNHYYERLDEWNAEHGMAPAPTAGPAAGSAWELHNLTADPEERHNRVDDAGDALSTMRGVLDQQREEKRLLPSLRPGAPGNRAWR